MYDSNVMYENGYLKHGSIQKYKGYKVYIVLSSQDKKV